MENHLGTLIYFTVTILLLYFSPDPAQELFCFKTLGAHGIHMGFKLPQHKQDCNKIENAIFLGHLQNMDWIGWDWIDKIRTGLGRINRTWIGLCPIDKTRTEF